MVMCMCFFIHCRKAKVKFLYGEILGWDFNKFILGQRKWSQLAYGNRRRINILPS